MARAGWPLALLLLVAAHAAVALAPAAPMSNGELWGADEYMRLVRVERLWATGAWYDGVILRSNAPYGEALHWTRPLDVLLIAGAAPLAPFLGFRQALAAWAMVFGPFLHAIALAAAWWAARPVLDRFGRFALLVVLALQPAAIVAFAAGRPDHHGLLLLLFLLLLGALWRALEPDRGLRPAILAGAIAAFGLWVSVEFLVPVGGMLVAFAGLWAARGGDFARRGAVALGTAALGVALALPVERPPDELLVVEHDRLSIVHLAGLALAAAAAGSLARLQAGIVGRCAALAGAAAVSAGTLWLAFPRALKGPMADVDPWVLSRWDPRLTENWPLIAPGDPAGSAALALMLLGLAVAGLPALGWLLARDGGRRAQWAALAVFLPAHLALALMAQRWAGYAAILCAFPFAALGGRLLARFNGTASRGAALAAALARGAAATAFGLAFTAAGGVALALAPDEDPPPAGFGCPSSELARHLGEAPELADRPRRVLACGFHGPEILYRSPHEVVASPYHRNAAGLKDAQRFFTAASPEAARAIAAARGVDLVAICPRSFEEQRCFAREGAPFYRALAEGRLPPWLAPLPLPPELAGRVGLFEVRREALSR